MKTDFSRTGLLLGRGGMERLAKASVLVFGLGGVGSYAAEALIRSGVGRIGLVDGDRVCASNLNRQLVAVHSTIGQLKTEAMRRRALDINPEARINEYPVFYTEQNAGDFPLEEYSYIVDAIDMVSSKLLLIERAQRAGVPVISCMGAGNKLDPTRLEVADIYSTSVCPLARVMRLELRRRGIRSLKVVYSREPVREPVVPPGLEREKRPGGRPAPGSVAFVPPVAGLILAGEVIRELSGVSAG